MGWYHSMDPEEMKAAMAEAAPSCSIGSRPPPANTGRGERAEEKASSGNTACPLPPSSPPPPPPPDADSLYHLCQRSIWEKAVKAKDPYFPPSFMADGKFTRASVCKDDLASTANTFYKDVPGDWIVLEINCKLLFGLGIPILAQDAPESTKKDPVKCLQVFGGISTTFPGLITKIYGMERSAVSGKFLSILEPSSSLAVERKEQAQRVEKKAFAPPEQAKKSKGKFRFFKK